MGSRTQKKTLMDVDVDMSEGPKPSAKKLRATSAALTAAAKATAELPSVEVHKNTPVEYDLACLAAFDMAPFDAKSSS